MLLIRVTFLGKIEYQLTIDS